MATNTTQINAIFERYPKGDASWLIDLLQDLQELHGYLSDDEMQNVADYIGVPVSRVYGVATFYNQFRFQPVGTYVIKVCRGTACHVKGSFDLLKTLESELGVTAGDTTRDRLFTLETVACIGACSIAPVVAVNEQFHGGLTTKGVQKLLRSYRAQAAQREVEHEHIL